MPPPVSTRGGARGGGRGGTAASKLKFQPKSSARRSKEEREAEEKKEQAVIRAEEAAAERERKKAEARAARGRGGAAGGRGRGGAARGGVSGWMSRGDGLGHFTGSMVVDRTPGVSLPSVQSGVSAPPAARGVSDLGTTLPAGSQSALGSGERGERTPKTEDTFRDDKTSARSNGTTKRMKNIDHINLISDDEDGPDEKGDGSATRKSRNGLLPIRFTRQEHVPRKTKVNIDLTTSSEKDERGAKGTAMEVDVESSDKMMIKIEDDEDVPTAPKTEPVSPTTKRRGRGRPKRNAGAEPAPEMVIDTDAAAAESAKDRQLREKLRDAQKSTAAQPAERPRFIREDCNFICAPRPAGWDSKEDTENWERNVHKMYLVYEELSFPEKMRIPEDSGKAGTVGASKGKGQAKDAAKAKATEGSAVDRKQDLVYLFQLAPGIPGIEGLRAQSDADQAASKALEATSTDDMDVSVLSRPASPKLKRSRSPETSRKKKPNLTAKEGGKAGQEATGEPVQTIKAEDASGEAQAKAATAAVGTDTLLPDADQQRPGYLGDLVVFNTGEARMDWGGLPLHLKMGLESDMLQQVLLTGAPVTQQAAKRAEEDAKKAGSVVKKEQQGSGSGGGGGSSTSATGGGGGGAGSGRVAASASGHVTIHDDMEDGDGGAGGSRNDDNGGGDNNNDTIHGGGKTDAGTAYAMGSVAGSFIAVPDFKAFFGDKWR